MPISDKKRCGKSLLLRDSRTRKPRKRKLPRGITRERRLRVESRVMIPRGHLLTGSSHVLFSLSVDYSSLFTKTLITRRFLQKYNSIVDCSKTISDI